ncbi:hypothetical protein KQI65_06375 [bacterium]|nr:hypothetical protein [bacterium]
MKNQNTTNSSAPENRDALHGGVAVGTRILLLVLLLLPFAGCGKGDKAIPKEETGEPNAISPELQLYKDARSTFRDWVTLFQRPRETAGPFRDLSAVSRRRLAARGVKNAKEFADWMQREEDRGRAPFIYEFSRFDILDIDVRDSSKAVITASFLVHRHQNTFESVSSFFLVRENGTWRVPFAESGNFETSWWQKEKNFLSRLREEGMAHYVEDDIGLSFAYPMTWDINDHVSVGFPGEGTHEGYELQYIDPTTLTPAAIVRIAVLTPDGTMITDTLSGSAEADSSRGLIMESRRVVQPEQASPMAGTLQVLRSAEDGRRVLFYTLFAGEGESSRFDQTFKSIRQSIILHKEQIP